MKKISDDDVELLIDKVLEVFPNVLSYLFGKKIDLKLTASREEKEKYVKTVKRYLGLISQMRSQIKQMKENEADPKEVLALYLSKMDEIQHLILPEISKNEHFVDYYIGFFTKRLKEPLEIDFIRATKYQRYEKLLKELIIEAIRAGKGEVIEQFFKQIDVSEDPIIFAQAVNIRLIKDYEFLDKKRIRLSKRTVMRYIKIFGELAGHYEKLISNVLGLMEITKNNVPDYGVLRQYSVSKKYWAVKKDPKYSEFTSSFNPIIRNSIAHSNFTFLPIEKKVKFMNLTGKIELTYYEFEERIKEFSALVLALSQIRSIFILIKYYQFKKFLEKTVT